jgi:hypothetical protein
MNQTTAGPAATFSPDELKTIYRILQSCWNEIGSDCIMASGEETLMTRDEVIEVVLDADHCRHHVKKDEKAVWERYEKLPYEQMIEIAKGTFKHARYGM